MRLANLPFKLESTVAREAMKALRMRPASDPYLSGDSFRALADLVFEGGTLRSLKALPRSGAPVVFVPSDEVKSFFRGGWIVSRVLRHLPVLVRNRAPSRHGILAKFSPP